MFLGSEKEGERRRMMRAHTSTGMRGVRNKKEGQAWRQNLQGAIPRNEADLEEQGDSPSLLHIHISLPLYFCSACLG